MRFRQLAIVLGVALLFLLSLSMASTYQSVMISKVAAVQQGATYEIVQHPLPNGSSQPWSIVSDNSGRLWFVEQQSDQIGMFNPSTNSFTEYGIPTPAALPESIAVDGSGNVWITELAHAQLGELKHGSSKIVEYQIPKGSENLSCGPIGVTSDQHGNVWITCEFSNQIDEFVASNSTFFEYNLPVFYSAPLDIVFDSQGNFWFTAADADMIGYATVSQLQNGTSNGIQEFAPSNPTYERTISDPQQPSGHIVSSLSTPSELALTHDAKSLWITEHTASSFDRYDIQTKTLTKYWTSQTHSAEFSTSLPNGIAVDSEGNVWIAEHYGNKIARFEPATDQLTEYPIPCCASGIAGSLYLALGPNGTVWFTEFYGNAIGELRPVQANQSLSIVLGSENVSMSTNGNTTVAVSVSTQNPSGGAQTVGLDVSGISVTGVLQNASATFTPSKLTFNQTGVASSKLDLKTNGLRPGTYYLTVGAKLPSNNVTQSTILKLTVTGTTEQYQSLIVYAAAVGVVLSVIVVGAIIFIPGRRSKKGYLSRRKAAKRR